MSDYLSTTPDQLASLGSYVAREWGDYGYRFERILSSTSHVTIGQVVCSDGGRFWVACDRYGNTRHGDGEIRDDFTPSMYDAIRELEKIATAV